MADKKLLKILSKGVNHWNEWNKKNRIKNSLHDLRYVNLRNENLSGANFSNTDLRKANLMGANLKGSRFICADLRDANFEKAELNNSILNDAHLQRTNFKFANLKGALLRRANLIHSIFSEANLTNANLERAFLINTDFRHSILINVDLSNMVFLLTNFFGANLYKVNLSKSKFFEINFSYANLQEVNFQSAELKGVVFGNTDLKNAKNLKTIIHHSFSIIDYRTILNSENLPDEFLRGCGLPDKLIPVYKDVLIDNPTQKYSCFISHSHTDYNFAHKLHKDLQINGVRCWFAPENMKIGDPIRDTIDTAIRIHDKLLIILSKSSINSKWVEDEVESAMEKETKSKPVIFPIAIDQSVFRTKKAWASKIRRSRNIGDFTNWKNRDSYKQAFDLLLNDLKPTLIK